MDSVDLNIILKRLEDRAADAANQRGLTQDARDEWARCANELLELKQIVTLLRADLSAAAADLKEARQKVHEWEGWRANLVKSKTRAWLTLVPKSPKQLIPF